MRHTLDAFCLFLYISPVSHYPGEWMDKPPRISTLPDDHAFVLPRETPQQLKEAGAVGQGYTWNFKGLTPSVLFFSKETGLYVLNGFSTSIAPAWKQRAILQLLQSPVIPAIMTADDICMTNLFLQDSLERFRERLNPHLSPFLQDELDDIALDVTGKKFAEFQLADEPLQLDFVMLVDNNLWRFHFVGEAPPSQPFQTRAGAAKRLQQYGNRIAPSEVRRTLRFLKEEMPEISA